LVRHLRDEHLSEPGIAEQLYQLLYALGALPPPESYVGQQQEGAAGGEFEAGFAPEPVATGAISSKLWTPGEPTAGSAEGGSKKIWTPT
jgi:hypothetical protein